MPVIDGSVCLFSFRAGAKAEKQQREAEKHAEIARSSMQQACQLTRACRLLVSARCVGPAVSTPLQKLL